MFLPEALTYWDLLQPSIYIKNIDFYPNRTVTQHISTEIPKNCSLGEPARLSCVFCLRSMPPLQSEVGAEFEVAARRRISSSSLLMTHRESQGFSLCPFNFQTKNPT